MLGCAGVLFLNTAMPQCRYCCVQALGAQYLKALDWLPPAKSGGNEDELHQKAGRASDVSPL